MKSMPYLLTLALAGLALGQVAGAEVNYHLLKEIPIGGDPKWDYLTLDAKGRHLYVAHSKQIEVIDLDQETVSAPITGTLGVHGFALAPELKRGFSSNGLEAKSSIVDLDTRQTLAKVATGEKPDAILYEPKNQEVYTFNGIAKSVTVFKAATGEVVATIPLPGKPEFAVVDPEGGFAYVNIEDKNEVVAIDTHSHQIVYTWPVTGGDAPGSLAIDLKNHRLFVGCHNNKLVVLDSVNGKIIATLPIGAGVDATVFDASTQLIFSSCGTDGATTIVHQDDPDHYLTVQTLSTAKGARTMAVDPTTHKIYLVAVTGGSFKTLVYGP